MNDQCRTCNLRGDMKKCEPVPCFNRDNWYAQEIIKERDALKDRLARIDAVRGKEAVTPEYAIEWVERYARFESPQVHEPLFLSAPTIPEGYWLAPNEPTTSDQTPAPRNETHVCIPRADYKALQAEVDELTRDVAQWKNNHATVVRQARVLKERTDMPLERVKAYEHYGEMIERVAEQSDLIARLKQEAQVHAQEARTANSTIAEIYQAISGATGEPGNWHGAEPVRTYINEKAALIEKCEVALSRSTRKLAAYYGLCSGDKELTETVLPLANEALAAIAAHQK